MSKCANCGIARADKACRTPAGKGPKFCPTLEKRNALARGREKYLAPEIREFARQAGVQEGSCYIERDASPHVLYPIKPRLQEICEFADRMGFKKLGLAFCAGLSSEAGTLAKILEKHGFDVVSVVCKVGCVPKEELGITEEEKVSIGNFESMCNPITQAEILNEANTDFNVLMGLCVGHDSLFLRNSNALTTIFAVKDRLLGHNPMAALYTSDSYYQRFVKKPKRFKDKVR